MVTFKKKWHHIRSCDNAGEVVTSQEQSGAVKGSHAAVTGVLVTLQWKWNVCLTKTRQWRSHTEQVIVCPGLTKQTSSVMTAGSPRLGSDYMTTCFGGFLISLLRSFYYLISKLFSFFIVFLFFVLFFFLHSFSLSFLNSCSSYHFFFTSFAPFLLTSYCYNFVIFVSFSRRHSWTRRHALSERQKLCQSLKILSRTPEWVR